MAKQGYAKTLTPRLQRVITRLKEGPLTGTHFEEVGLGDNNSLKVAMTHLRHLGYVIESRADGSWGKVPGRRPGVYHLIREPELEPKPEPENVG